MKKYIFLILFCFSQNIFAINLGDLVGGIGGGIAGGAINSALESLDKQFNGLLNKSLTFANACLGENYKLGVKADDICAIAGKLDNLKTNVCGQNVGLSGIKALCQAKQREFNNYISNSVVNLTEWAMLRENNNSQSPTLPNGINLNEFNKNWDINNILKNSNVVSDYLKDGKMNELNLIINYAKSYNAKSNPKDIKIENIKAPANLNEYKNGIVEYVNAQKAIFNNARPSASATLAKKKLSENENADLSQLANDIKIDYDNAKIAEIGNELALNDYKKIAIPTQEYINLLRPDLKANAIAQIQKQQAFESQTIIKIEEKWNKKYNLAKLLIDKETILAQKFDEKTAKNEIDRIANGS